MLIATLPPITREQAIDEMVGHPLVSGVRYNVGMRTPYSAGDTLARILRVTTLHRKPLWVDLKGRQLRIVQWADPTYGDIVLNHNISVDLPADIWFRGGGSGKIIAVEGNTIFVDPIPSHALGAGQAVNIIGTHLVIDGYLTDRDLEYMDAAKTLGIGSFMLSFVEAISDISDVLYLCPAADLVLKIESEPGLALVERYTPDTYPRCHLMAARDDLMIQLGRDQTRILSAVKRIITKDPDAIVASHLLTSLASPQVSAADISDLYLMRHLGYQHMLLSDTISHYHFREAMAIWEQFLRLEMPL